MTSLSMNLKKLRHNKRLTQKQVANEVGISQGNYSSIEAGKVEPSLSALISLAQFFGETLDTLTSFVHIVDESEPLTVEEEMWVDTYRNMEMQERSFAIGMLSVIKNQREKPYGYLPRDMDMVDWDEEMKQKRGMPDEEDE